MPAQPSRTATALSLNLIMLLAAPLAKAQTLPPYAGTQCFHFATQPEAQWHYYMGTAPATVDADRDGIACPALTQGIRQEGSRIFSNQANRRTERFTLEVWRVSTTDVYLRIKSSSGLDFTTRSFPSDREAREHMRTYYQNLLN
ncbi:hypothetical protein GFS31_24410 [Leptolyngbya sp. BL0902]|uniref:hypothetical protein n=1 Tax=Leptolyngbya sp. BL0902 TaxID=1115757 RepID=UPI0018E803F8|nr:hypothetical protein [Leptolyngbya sp. BL0902]QQE65752.1 hypothetical protein GFS31_24410 [Leptolyngbya sp. BL0902]